MSPSICLSPLDRSETLRYLGMTEVAADDAFLSRLDACEAKLLRHATPLLSCHQVRLGTLGTLPP